MTAQTLRSWSFSALMQYESCPMRVKLAKIDRLPELPRDPKTDPLERGNRIHKNLEAYIRGEIDELQTEARAIGDFQEALDDARELYAEGYATVEQDWIFDRDWGVSDRANVWLWAKLDLAILDEKNSLLVVIDHKSGRSEYKAAEHAQQMQLYSAISALRYEWALTIVVELWYVDEGHIKPTVYTREQALRYIGRFQDRADRMLTDTKFRPNPNRITCKWCPYSPRGTGACPVGQ